MLAADSFRVRVNQATGVAEARGLQMHLARFGEAAREALHGNEPTLPVHTDLHTLERETMLKAGFGRSITPEAPVVLLPLHADDAEKRTAAQVGEFAREATARIAQYGEGWPRLELWGAADGCQAKPELRLTFRALPALQETIGLRAVSNVDVEWPERKGPNIAAYATLNRDLGCEALLLDDNGHVREGTTTSLLWWQANRLHRVASGSRVQSITEALITETVLAETALADYAPAISGPQSDDSQHPLRATDVIVSPGITPSELTKHEVWAVNALHGIRVVTSIDGVETPEPNCQRLQWFRERLNRMWQPVES